MKTRKQVETLVRDHSLFAFAPQNEHGHVVVPGG